MFSITLTGFLVFLKTAIFVVGYISNNSLFPEPLSQDEESIYIEKMKNGEEAKNILNDEKNVEEQVDLKFQIKKLYLKMKELLKDRERVILELRFGLHGRNPKTQNQIAKMMGISRSYVSRIETKAIDKLAQEIDGKI